ncbi:fructosamine kinase family protein [Glaciibacter flavus]|uniref:fructosamine kinase family protein n=1 Tax=Orlajensenia flava TaxID=2565934 RepID=UPI001F298708|nr:fructosamine kinase family protein [Glaciibacter flavus]
MTTFVKTREDAPPGFFEAEAAGLRWLAAARGAHCVGVVAVSPGRIELDQVAETRPTGEAARSFGRALAHSHRAGAARFGSPPSDWDGPLYIGRRELPAVTGEHWGRFYAEGRVLPFLAPAVSAGNLRPDEADVVRRACDRLSAGDFDDDESPARLHGDLWAGNVLWSPDGVVLIDPAAQGGHRETDLAMLALFGLPHLAEVLEAYDDAAPLRSGWRERVPLHQLHPLAVHAAGHGRHYGLALIDAAQRVLELPEN